MKSGFDSNTFRWRLFVDDIDYLTDQLDKFDRNEAIKAGLAAAAEVFRSRGRSNLRARLLYRGSNGDLLRSMTTRTATRRLVAFAGFSNIGPHAHLVDRGTVRRYTKSGANRGIMPGNLFWSDARKSEENRAFEAIREGVARAVERINNRQE